ncbi:OLC1v1015249C1 [Oldenlandia corymbosa var. corymbosa]|uniref:Pectinesterase n=1 Tax=Oldenlandia corymbosa var. corymbosa TaxID=529605 RepID=A0AAV1E514_OLDCO|nr:OLC1v1015249C1 [Oldenlandia corymbosa var. corymbosa]
MSHSGNNYSIPFSKKRKQLFLTLFSAVLLVGLVDGVAAAGVNNENHSSSSSSNNLATEIFEPHHAIINSACSAARHPELCLTTLATAPIHAKRQIKSQKNVIELALNITHTTVEHNYFAVKKVLEKRAKLLTEREKTALHDCLETIDYTLDELHTAMEDLKLYPTQKSLKQHANDLKTLISSAITNQDTCLDGFSHDQADKKVRKVLEKGEVHVEKLCSNVLAMIKNMTDTDIANEELRMQLSSNAGGSRKLMSSAGDGWPEWLSAGDRKLLQASTVTPDVVVAADGSGNYRTVSAAVAAAPTKSSRRYVIRIKAGVYRENVDVPKGKTNIMFMGDGRANTIITGSRNVVDGSTTFHSATVGELL